MSLEEAIQELVVALERNTKALLSGGSATQAKPETATQKKARLKREKKAAKGVEQITVVDIRKQAKEICTANDVDNPQACVEQIRELVCEVAADRFDDADVPLDKFDGPALYVLEEKLKDFQYDAEPTETTDEINI